MPLRKNPLILFFNSKHGTEKQGKAEHERVERTEMETSQRLFYLASPLPQTTIIALFNGAPVLVTMFLVQFSSLFFYKIHKT